MSFAVEEIAPVALEASPAERWLDLVRRDGTAPELASLYLDHPPLQGEIIFTGACAYTCAHCIYPPDFAAANRSLEAEVWETLFLAMHNELGVNTFVYGGRSVSSPGIDTMKALRRSVPSAYVGMIDNAVSYVPFRNELINLRLDWIDISVDGDERSHDLQRGKPGGYRETIAGIDWLLRNQAAPKINILTCLTSLNIESVVPMIKSLRGHGLPNYFITPVAFLDGVRPDPSLRIEGKVLVDFIDALIVKLPTLNDVWIELVYSDADLLASLLKAHPEWLRRMSVDRDSLIIDLSVNHVGSGLRNELLLRYSPLSMTGTRELIVNTNGDVVVPKSVGYGKIPESMVVGNLTQQQPAEMHRSLVVSQAFEFYATEFKKERALLRTFFQ
jgi:hypothetical protein